MVVMSIEDDSRELKKEGEVEIQSWNGIRALTMIKHKNLVKDTTNIICRDNNNTDTSMGGSM